MGTYANPLTPAERSLAIVPSATANNMGFGYRRKDRMNSAAQHKRASSKAANRTKHRRTA